jgi:glycerol kinase
MEYSLEGSVFSAGAAVQWLRDGLGIIRDASEIEPLARSVPDSGGVVFVPAFTGLGAPHWDPHARGTIVGITRGTTRAHLARAALEATAHQVADVVEAMAGDARAARRVESAAWAGQTGAAEGMGSAWRLRVDGGAASNDLLLQLQADLLGAPVDRCCTREATAVGAAVVVGLQRQSADGAVETFKPRMAEAERAGMREQWAAGVKRTR